jgi:hypothetical protein
MSPALLTVLALLSPWAAVQAQAPATAPVPASPSPSVVTVRATRDPVDKSYRRMVDGMDRFEKDHALAPLAPLRFRLLPRDKDIDMHGITLKVVGDTMALPVPVADDGSFTLPRNAVLLREDAALVANRKTDSMTWRVSVQTPGLPPDTRRLGDLRLECLAGMESGLISNGPALIGWISGMLRDADSVCSSPQGDYLFFADRPLFGVTLHAGERREPLPFHMLYAGGHETPSSLVYCDCQVMLDRAYFAPLWDRRWPDDTLLEFDYMDASATGGSPQ